MKLQYFVAGAAVIALAAVVWWTQAGDNPTARPDAPTPIAAAPDTAAAPMAESASPTASGPARPQLDCREAKGDAARHQSGHVTVEQLCHQLERRAGKLGAGDPIIQRQQARRVLDRIVDEQLVAAALAQEHTAVSRAEVEQELERIQQRTMRAGEVGLAAALGQQGLDIADVRDEVRWKLELARLVSLRGTTELAVGAVEREYLDHPERYRQGGGVKVLPFLAPLPRDAEPAKQQEAERRARDFAAQVASVGAPEKLPLPARLRPLPAYTLQPGDPEPAVAAAVATKKVGEWTNPVKTQAGWLVCQVLNIDLGQAKPLDQARAEIEQRLRAVQRLSDQERIQQALRAAAQVEVLVDL